jgi:hypothetical protein
VRRDELAVELQEEALLDLPVYFWTPDGRVIETRSAGPDDLYLVAADEEHKAAWETEWVDRFERLLRVWTLRWLAERRS